MKKNHKIYFVPLGGCGEIGMNMSLFGLQTRDKFHWIMVDCGINFTSDIPGVEVVMPEISFLDEIDLRAVIITHAHEDHIGAMPYLWKKFKSKIYLPSFAKDVLLSKFGDDKEVENYTHVYDDKDKIKIDDFNIEFFHLTHSIPDAFGLLLEIFDYKIFHSGDFKIDYEPSLGKKIDFSHIERIGNKNIDLLTCDSTNIFTEGRSASEQSVRDALEDLLSTLDNLIVVTTFASNVGRIKSLFEISKKINRSICLLGRSMKLMVQHGSKIFNFYDYDIIDEKEVKNLPKSKVIILATGSQGEIRAAIARLARDENKNIKLSAGDNIVFSSKNIPGNEKSIAKVINNLSLMGVNIINKNADIHASGHPCREELSELYNLVKPKNHIPIHGEAMHLLEHKNFAIKHGIKSHLILNGDMVSLYPKVKIIDKINTGRLCVDGNTICPIEADHIRERKKMAYSGLAIVNIFIDKKQKLKGDVQLKLLGISFPNFEENRLKICSDIKEYILQNPKNNFKEDEYITNINRIVRKSILNLFGKKPLIETSIYS